MTTNNASVPAGFTTLTPYLVVDRASEAIDFYERAFGAEQTFRLNGEDGRVMHAELRIGDSMIMMAEKADGFTFMQTADDVGGSPVQLYLYLPDADATFQQALLCGAEVVMPLEIHDDGDTRGGVRDPFGFLW